MANIHRTPEQWRIILEQYSASGIPIAAFCKQQKLNTSSFYAWRKRLADTSLYSAIPDNNVVMDNNKPDWVNIIPEQQVPSPSWDIELALPNGVVLRMNNC